MRTLPIVFVLMFVSIATAEQKRKPLKASATARLLLEAGRSPSGQNKGVSLPRASAAPFLRTTSYIAHNIL